MIIRYGFCNMLLLFRLSSPTPPLGICNLSRFWLFCLGSSMFLLPKIFTFIYSLSVPDEGYSRNASYALHLISTFLLCILAICCLMMTICVLLFHKDIQVCIISLMVVNDYLLYLHF